MHLEDETGKKPHERAGARDCLAENSEYHQKQLTRIFDVGFRAALEGRWPSALALEKEIQSLLEPPDLPCEEDLKSFALRI